MSVAKCSAHGLEVYPRFSVSASLFLYPTVGSSSVIFSSLNKPKAPSGHQKGSLNPCEDTLELITLCEYL